MMGNNSKSKPDHYTKILVDNARAFGWMNGLRLGKKVQAAHPAAVKAVKTGGAVVGQVKL